MGKGNGKGAKSTDSNMIVAPTASKEKIRALEKQAQWKPLKKIRPADLELLYEMEKQGAMLCVTDPMG